MRLMYVCTPHQCLYLDRHSILFNLTIIHVEVILTFGPLPLLFILYYQVLATYFIWESFQVTTTVIAILEFSFDHIQPLHQCLPLYQYYHLHHPIPLQYRLKLVPTFAINLHSMVVAAVVS